MQKLDIFAKPFLGIACLVLFLSTGTAFAQTSTFTYQGKLIDANFVPDGSYDMQFKLFNKPTAGSQVGSTLTFDGSGLNAPAVSVTNGAFTVQLDFGASSFPGADRFLEVAIRYPNDTVFTPLNSRPQLTSNPYAIRSLNAAAADIAANAKKLDGIAATEYVQTTDPRLFDKREPTIGSLNYIQNTTIQQASSNFNISGNGTAGGELSSNAVNVVTQYNIGGLRVLSAESSNLFAGIGAGQSNPTGTHNSFFGKDAGLNNTVGHINSFFGSRAGRDNTIGGANSFFGRDAGLRNTEGSSNSFFGSAVGVNTTTGFSNSFFGTMAGTGNTTGADNSFFGRSTGMSNTTGSHITLIGSNANVGSDGLNYATAIGAGAIVSSPNTVVVGRNIDIVRIPGNFLASGTMTLSTLSAAGQTTLCRNIYNQISNCSSSLRYKTNIAPFSFGLNLINRLNPISYDWKAGGPRDVGFGAEEVAAINPLFVSYNSEGQVEGVKYDRLSVAFVNAFKEQQAQIEQQRNQISKQQDQLEALRKLVCLNHPNADACK